MPKNSNKITVGPCPVYNVWLCLWKWHTGQPFSTSFKPSFSPQLFFIIFLNLPLSLLCSIRHVLDRGFPMLLCAVASDSTLVYQRMTDGLVTPDPPVGPFQDVGRRQHRKRRQQCWAAGVRRRLCGVGKAREQLIGRYVWVSCSWKTAKP